MTFRPLSYMSWLVSLFQLFIPFGFSTLSVHVCPSFCNHDAVSTLLHYLLPVLLLLYVHTLHDLYFPFRFHRDVTLVFLFILSPINKRLAAFIRFRLLLFYITRDHFVIVKSKALVKIRPHTLLLQLNRINYFYDF